MATGQQPFHRREDLGNEASSVADVQRYKAFAVATLVSNWAINASWRACVLLKAELLSSL